MKNEWKSPAAGATLIILLTLAAYLPGPAVRLHLG